MLRRLRIQDGKLVESDEANGDVLVYVCPEDAEKKHLVEQYKIDEHTLNSALDPDELARLEFEPEHMALIFKRPKNYSSEDNYLFRVASAGLFLFKDRLVLVLDDDARIFEGKQFAKVKSLQDIILKLIHRSIFHYEAHLRTINMISGELEHEVNTAMTNKHLLNLFTLEKSLVYYLNAINSNGKVIDRMRTNAAKIGLTPENLEFLDDVIIENNQCYEQAEIYSHVLSSLMDARVSVVSNNLNVLMKTLTLVMIAIMVPTLVVSIFSMNVDLPLGKTNPSFWVIGGLAIFSAVLVGLVWRYRKL